MVVSLGTAVAAFACGGEAERRDLGSTPLAKTCEDSGIYDSGVVDGYVGPARPQLAYGVGKPRGQGADAGIRSLACPTSVVP